jgi:hypothetical protein
MVESERTRYMAQQFDDDKAKNQEREVLYNRHQQMSIQSSLSTLKLSTRH